MQPPSLPSRLNRQEKRLKNLTDHVAEISDRLTVIEDEIRIISNKTTNGNWSRNIIGSVIMLKLAFEGLGSVHWLELLKAFGG